MCLHLEVGVQNVQGISINKDVLQIIALVFVIVDFMQNSKIEPEHCLVDLLGCKSDKRHIRSEGNFTGETKN